MQSSPSPSPNPTPRRKVRIPVWLFLAVIAVLSAALYTIPHFRRHNNPELTIRDGRNLPPQSRLMQTLADGTKFWINDSSDISYQTDFKTPIRELWLKGEGYFIVPKEARPFIVHTPILDVTVNGATFDVNVYEGDRIAEASIFNDSASVTFRSNPSKKEALQSGDKLIVQAGETSGGPLQPVTRLDKVHYRPEDSLFIEAAWIKYRLAGYNTNLEELTPRFRRLYGMKLIISDDQLKKQRFTVVLPDFNFELTLQMLQLVQPFHYTIVEQEVYIRP